MHVRSVGLARLTNREVPVTASNKQAEIKRENADGDRRNDKSKLVSNSHSVTFHTEDLDRLNRLLAQRPGEPTEQTEGPAVLPLSVFFTIAQTFVSYASPMWPTGSKGQKSCM